MPRKTAKPEIPVDIERLLRKWAASRNVPDDVADRVVSAAVEAAKSELVRRLPAGTPNGLTWKDDREPGETPPHFVLRVYGKAGWLDLGMTLKQLRDRDQSLVHRLYAWVREKNELPPEFGSYLQLVRDHGARAISPKG